VAHRAFAKISHTSFSVSDAAVSAEFWHRVLGFEDLEAVEGEGWHGMVMLHPPTGTVLEVQQHDANRGERFDPARTGFDHLGFMVTDPAELDGWQAHFTELGVDFTPAVHRDYGSVLTFRDPDGIQFEMFYRQGHP
jgi:glyoxylase I family protein